MSNKQKYSRVIRHGVKPSIGVTALRQPQAPEMLPDGRLPLVVMAAPLRVVIPVISELTNPVWDNVVLFWDNVEVPASRYNFDLADTTEHELELPVDVMTNSAEGVHQLDYVTRLSAGQNETRANVPLTLIIDRTAPGGSDLGPLIFNLAVDGVVTESDLNAAGELVATIPNWNGEGTGDVATPEIAPKAVPLPADWLQLPNSKETVTTVGAPLSFKLPRADLSTVDGVQSFSWNVVDQLGNVRPPDERAPAVRLRTLVGSPPSNLLAPAVPAFDLHEVVTWADAQGPLLVDISPYDNIAEGDMIVVTWGTQEALPAPIGKLPVAPSPLPDPIISVEMDIKKLIAEGDGSVAVAYRVERGIDKFGPSPATTVLVNLTIPGGEDLFPETPEHENLKLLKVTSSSGQQNVIPAADFDKDGVITIYHLGEDGGEVFVATDTVDVSWGPTLKIPFTVIDPTVDLAIPLDSDDIIQKGPKGAFDVSYTVSRALGVGNPPQFGVAQSLPTNVRVVSSADIPGGGANLVDPNFTEKDTNNVINKAAGMDGTPIRITLPIANMTVGDSLHLRFAGHYSLTDPNGAEIPDSQVELVHPLLQLDIDAKYYDFIITEPQLRFICEGLGTAIYTATNSKGEVDSAKIPVTISVRAANYCITPRP
ncbi:hypothetical protein KDX30_25890 [Pseudomonas sp. CDFA 553]|uniref:hypothetical protein n=1 Tax=Pseudomonas quasicaspiana TaxID=2829821 RepID=UPI001E3F4F16|nr:hypothetical protein [Pseudomonas quasicaspiana]MCD5991316.1 hypothetical protein [Pseudomonas quasicaspiana]